MQRRPKLLVPILLLLVAVTGCSGLVSQSPTAAPPAVRTLRPTFTPRPTAVALAATTAPRPADTATPVPAAPTAAPTQVPPTAAPTVEPATPAPILPTTFSVNNAASNVRSGPGTNYPVLGQVRQGEQYDITGKNTAGDWWQFNFNGDPGWILANLVSVKGDAGAVLVAKHIPSPPAPVVAPPVQQPAAQQPVVRPPAPTPVPAPPSTRFATTMLEPRENTAPYVTVFCMLLVRTGDGLLPGTVRVSGAGQNVELSFRPVMVHGNPGYDSEFAYSDGCKAEMPFVEGSYTAVLIEGGNPVSDPINFTVAGTTRTFLVRWRER
jgi:uncharacterized protein YraI